MRAAITIKLIEENIGVNLRDLGLGNGFLHDTKNIRNEKINKLGIIKI